MYQDSTNICYNIIKLLILYCTVILILVIFSIHDVYSIYRENNVADNIFNLQNLYTIYINIYIYFITLYSL